MYGYVILYLGLYRFHDSCVFWVPNSSSRLCTTCLLCGGSRVTALFGGAGFTEFPAAPTTRSCWWPGSTLIKEPCLKPCGNRPDAASDSGSRTSTSNASGEAVRFWQMDAALGSNVKKLAESWVTSLRVDLRDGVRLVSAFEIVSKCCRLANYEDSLTDWSPVLDFTDMLTFLTWRWSSTMKVSFVDSSACRQSGWLERRPAQPQKK